MWRALCAWMSARFHVCPAPCINGWMTSVPEQVIYMASFIADVIGIVEDDYIGKNWRCVWWKGLQLSEDAFCCIDYQIRHGCPASVSEDFPICGVTNIFQHPKSDRGLWGLDKGHSMMKSWTFQDTSLTVWMGSIPVLTNRHSHFSFSSVVWCFHAGLFWRHRQAISNASAATYWFAFTIATGVIKWAGRPHHIPSRTPTSFAQEVLDNRGRGQRTMAPQVGIDADVSPIWSNFFQSARTSGMSVGQWRMPLQSDLLRPRQQHHGGNIFDNHRKLRQKGGGMASLSLER